MRCSLLSLTRSRTRVLVVTIIIERAGVLCDGCRGGGGVLVIALLLLIERGLRYVRTRGMRAIGCLMGQNWGRRR